MKRFLAIVAIIAALSGGGVAALWYVNQNQARTQILLALEQLDRAGVQTEYDDFSITGFPFAYGGSFHNLKAVAPSRGVSLDLPEAVATMSIGSIGTVEFQLPREFVVTFLDAAGGEATMLRIESDDLVARVAPAGADAFDLGVAAARLRASPMMVTGAGGEHVEFRDLSATGVLSLDRAADRGQVDARFSAGAVLAEFPAAATGAGKPDGALNSTGALTANGLSGALQGDLTEVSAHFKSERLQAQSPDAGEMTLAGLEIAMKAAPDGEFRPGDLFDSRSAAEATMRLLTAALDGVARGGAFESDVRVGSVTLDMAAEIEGARQVASIAGQGLAYTTQVNPKTIGLGFSADTIDLRSEGPEAVRYDIEGLELALETNATKRFDLSPLADAATAEIAALALADLIRAEVADGGTAELRMTTRRGDASTALKAPEIPFDKIDTSSGATHTALTLSADAVRLESTGETARYEVAGAFNGGGGAQSVAMTAVFPLRALDAAQKATLIYDISGVTLDDALWALFDPAGKMPREIPGLRVDIGMEMILTEDLLRSREPWASPPIFHEVTANQLVLDMMGLRAEAAGAFDVRAPIPTGKATVKLRAWRGFLDNFSATPFGASPEGQILVLTATGWMAQFAEPGEDADTSVLNLVVDDTGVSVNGKPLNGGVEPAPEAAPGVQPDPAPQQ